MKTLILAVAIASSLGAQPWPRPRLVPVAGGLRYPVDIQNCGDGSGRLFVVEQEGRIRIFQDGALRESPFLDLRSRVRFGGERGLLGLAFPPDFAAKQYFYVNYTEGRGAPDLRTVVARYRVRAEDPHQADPNSEERILVVDQPYDNHNGGQLAFSPRDGHLYVGMGDGGSANDPLGAGQDPKRLLGKMLRIDVEGAAGAPSTAPEMWALGLRNPWRFSFDRETGDLWIGDVGQNRREEVNFQPADATAGLNYGWSEMEASLCLRAGCRTDGMVLPVFEYGRDLGVSVTGGHVYRGPAHEAWRGVYFLADFGTARFWGLRRDGTSWTNQELMVIPDAAISTFGLDEVGELYIATYGATDSGLFRLADRTPEIRAEYTLDAATGEPGVRPGSEVVLHGWGIALEPGATRVWFDGEPGEVRAVENQGGREFVVAKAPAELEGQETVEVVLESGGERSQPIRVRVLAARAL